MYIKINGEETRYNDRLEPFTTQHGYEAVRFVGDDIPETDKGFKVYGDDDTEMFDLSRYTHPYGKNEFCVEEDSIEPIEPAEYKPLPPNPLDVRLANMNKRISAITPYEQTKTAYFGENEKVFYGVPQGNTSVFFSDYNGEYEISRVEDRLTVSFPKMAGKTDITIMVQ